MLHFKMVANLYLTFILRYSIVLCVFFILDRLMMPEEICLKLLVVFQVAAFEQAVRTRNRNILVCALLYVACHESD